MTPEARLKAVSDLLVIIEENTSIPADSLVANYFRNHRYIGSKDRRFLGDFLYGLLRQRGPSLYWRHVFEKEKWAFQSSFRPQDIEILAFFLLYQNASLNDLERVCSDASYGFSKLSYQERAFFDQVLSNTLSCLPEWVQQHVPEELIPFFYKSFKEGWKDEIITLTLEPPFDARINPLLITRKEMQNHFLLEGIETTSTPFSPFGVRFSKRFPLMQHTLFKEGKMEIQEEGSQLLCQLLGHYAPKRVLDFCAGAGGKTILLGALMKNKGQIIATDTNAVRLQKAKERIKRSGLQNIQIRSLEDMKYFKRQKETFDGVLVDAPCTGSGTWRRNPDQKWKTRSQDIERLSQLQLSILKSASSFVSSNGYLLYATCSLFVEENEELIEAFLQTEEGKLFHLIPAKESLVLPENAFKGPFLSLSPHRTQTDGFFGALMKKNI